MENNNENQNRNADFYESLIKDLLKVWTAADFGCGCCAGRAGWKNANRFEYLMMCLEKNETPTDEGWQEWSGLSSELWEPDKE